MKKIFEFFLCAVLGASVLHSQNHMAIDTLYQVNLDKQYEPFYLRAGITLYRWIGGRFAKLGMSVDRKEGSQDISIFDADKKRIVYLAPDALDNSFILDPRTGKIASYTKEALEKIYSLFDFVAAEDRKAGAEHFISFSYTASDTGKTSYHAILLQIKDEAIAPFEGVDTTVYGGKALGAWRIHLWALRSEDGELNRSNAFEKGVLNLYCEGYVANGGELRGTILGLRVRTISKSQEHFADLKLKKLEMR